MANVSKKHGRPAAEPNVALTNRLSLRPQEMARSLGISPRLLSDLTDDDGGIPHVRLTRRLVIYPVAAVEQWLTAEATKKGAQP